MKKLTTLFLLFLAAVALPAATVTFDDLGGTCNNTSGNVADGYGGINWGGNWTCYTAVQPPYTPASGTARVYDLSNSTNFFSFPSPTVFDGAYFSGTTTTTVQFLLYSGVNLVGSSAILGTTSTPTFLASGYGGTVDKVVVDSNQPDFFVMDDVTYGGSNNVNTTIPEPLTFGLLGAGLGVMAVVRRLRA